MRIFGVDFTSAPRPAKPITWASAWLEADSLHIEAVAEITRFDAFEAALNQPGVWRAGLDFPFGQPAPLIDYFGWGETWAEMVGHVAALDGMADFERLLKRYRDAHPAGAKQPLRPVDARAKSRSPMMLYGVPVGRMFFEGAPRLLRAGVHVAPNHPLDDSRVVFEAYPALAARQWIGSAPYKQDDRRKQGEAQRAARGRILDGLRGDAARHYGLTVTLPAALAAAMIDDGTADRLDAGLCALQAAWAARQPSYGIPPEVDPREGWIVDPALSA